MTVASCWCRHCSSTARLRYALVAGAQTTAAAEAGRDQFDDGLVFVAGGGRLLVAGRETECDAGTDEVAADGDRDVSGGGAAGLTVTGRTLRA